MLHVNDLVVELADSAQVSSLGRAFATASEHRPSAAGSCFGPPC